MFEHNESQTSTTKMTKNVAVKKKAIVLFKLIHVKTL